MNSIYKHPCISNNKTHAVRNQSLGYLTFIFSVGKISFLDHHHRRHHSPSTMATNPSIPEMTAIPPKPAVKVTDRKYDSDGKVTNWCVNWPEARELATLVITGTLMV
jgi:hypothetical protein